MKTKILAYFSLLSWTSLVACSEDIDSDDVRTSGFYAEYLALATGDGSTELTARLKTGGKNSNTFAELRGDDELVASTEDETQVMSQSGSGNRSPYEAVFDTDAGGTLFNIALERGELDDDASFSMVELPEPFSVSFEDLDRGDPVERGQDVVVLWDNESSGTMSWSVDGDCIWSRSGTTGDDGSLSLSDEHIEVQTLDEGEDCEVTITLERKKDGSVDSALGGGSFQAIQRRKIRFVSTPSEDESSAAGGSRN